MPNTIQSLLNSSSQRLSRCSETPKLDAELLLAKSLGVNRTYLHIHPEQLVSNSQCEVFTDFMLRREHGEPAAYLLGQKDFWTLTLEVTKDTLIPRPETELLIELVLEKLPQKNIRIADLGTGSGAIALAIASERSQWEVWATDKMAAAITVAQRNAQRLSIRNVTFLLCEWCASLPHKYFDCIVSNPPYVAVKDLVLLPGDVRFEPATALAAGEDGLQDIKIIISQAPECLVAGGWLMLEHGYDQRAAVRELFKQAAYHEITSLQDLAGQDRITIGRLTD